MAARCIRPMPCAVFAFAVQSTHLQSAKAFLMPSDSVSFDRAVDYYDQTRGFPPGVDAEIAPLFVRAGGLTKDSRVLEIGVGTGRIALPLARHVGAYFGADLSAGMLGRLRGKQRGEPVYVAQADITQLPYAAASFDAVVAVHVFHLVPRWRDALEEVRRALKPGGVLLHGGGQPSGENQLDQVWRQAVQPKEAQPALAYRAVDSDFLEEAGWSAVGDQLYHYNVERSPLDYLDAIQRRLWSRCWKMSDEEIERGYRAVKAYVDEHYPDPAQPISTPQTFRVRVYRPPM